MNSISDAEDIVIKTINRFLLDKNSLVNSDTPLIGSYRVLDSMNLIEVCLALEDIAKEIGFEFDWTSESAMSKSTSIFRTVHSLAKVFLEQKELQS